MIPECSPCGHGLKQSLLRDTELYYKLRTHVSSLNIAAPIRWRLVPLSTPATTNDRPPYLRRVLLTNHETFYCCMFVYFIPDVCEQGNLFV